MSPGMLRWKIDSHGMSETRFFKNLALTVLVAGMLMLGGCATFSRPPLEYNVGAVVETLSATASFSVSKGEQGMGSSGFLLYQRPDKMRMVILSPFGTTVMEAIMSGDEITVINPSKSMAFRGRLEDLPARGEGETWRQARWVMDTDKPGSFIGNGSLQRLNSLGMREQVTFENGLVVSKVMPNGDTVSYNDYELVNGVPLATEIVMESHDGGRLRIKINEPEVNTELSPQAFIPRLDDLKILPLEALQEQ